MLPRAHLILGILFSVTLFYLFPQIGYIGLTIILFSSVLIDIDHYFYYVYKKKDWNLKKAYFWFLKKRKQIKSLPREKRNEFYTVFPFLHGIEVLILLFLLGKFFSVYFYFVLIGFSFHLFLDISFKFTFHKRLDRISLIYSFFKFKKLKFIEELEK